MSSTGGIMWLLAPLLLAGVSNMIFVKTKLCLVLARPMDGGMLATDGQRLLGDNKTWRGFAGMVIFSMFWMAGYQIAATNWPPLVAINLAVFPDDILPITGLFYGMLFGLAYMLFELPNSYIKRRLNIPPGTNVPGIKGKSFLLIDQFDSAIGCALVLPVMYDAHAGDIVLFILLGGGVHYITNLFLYAIGLKKQAG